MNVLPSSGRDMISMDSAITLINESVDGRESGKTLPVNVSLEVDASIVLGTCPPRAGTAVFLRRSTMEIRVELWQWGSHATYTQHCDSLADMLSN
jgi:hypothetical protein